MCKPWDVEVMPFSSFEYGQALLADEDLSLPVLLLKDHDLHSNFLFRFYYWQITFGCLQFMILFQKAISGTIPSSANKTSAT